MDEYVMWPIMLLPPVILLFVGHYWVKKWFIKYSLHHIFLLVWWVTMGIFIIEIIKQLSFILEGEVP